MLTRVARQRGVVESGLGNSHGIDGDSKSDDSQRYPAFVA